MALLIHKSFIHSELRRSTSRLKCVRAMELLKTVPPVRAVASADPRRPLPEPRSTIQPDFRASWIRSWTFGPLLIIREWAVRAPETSLLSARPIGPCIRGWSTSAVFSDRLCGLQAGVSTVAHIHLPGNDIGDQAGAVLAEQRSFLAC